MENITTYLTMGGYAAYVWTSFIITAVVLGGALLSAIRFQKRNDNLLKTLQKENSGEA